MVEDEVGTVKVDEMGVNKLKGDVGVRAGFTVAAASPESGVDADSVANRFEVWVGETAGALHARMNARATIKISPRLFIFIPG